jgi:hypothetical protein
MEFYREEGTKGNKSQKQYEEEYQDDFAIIEYIVEKSGKEGEEFCFGYMQKDWLKSFDDWHDVITKEEAFPVTDKKEGLRVLLFLMLQVCIVSGGGDLKEDLGALWQVYKSFLKEPKQNNKYWPLFYEMFNLTVAFQQEEVS